MPRTLRFHLDEHCDNAIARGLRSRGIDVTTSPEAGLLGAPDTRQLAFAGAGDRVMVTKDTDFLRLHASGVAHAGIVWVTKRHDSIGDVVRGLIVLWETRDPDDIRNTLRYL